MARKKKTSVLDQIGCLDDFERLALASLNRDRRLRGYVVSGAADGLTIRANRDAFDAIRLRQHVLNDVSAISTATSLFGEPLDHPIMLAPTSPLCWVTPNGEEEVLKGASMSNALYIVSSFLTVPFEAPPKLARPRPWFQLYLQPERRDEAGDIVTNLARWGYAAVCLTVDTPVPGARYGEAKERWQFRAKPCFTWMTNAQLHGNPTVVHPTIYAPFLDASITWDIIRWIRKRTKLPIILKGIMNPDDAAKAKQVGVDGIIVSNHGGRNLDTLPATIEVLPHIVRRVGRKYPVLIDGGIRRGTDVLKAIAFGAQAVLIGRPYIYGLRVGRAAGVAKVIDILRREFEMAMALTGCRSVDQINTQVIWK